LKNYGNAWPWRFGIAAKLIIGCTVAGILILFVCAVAVFAMEDFVNVVDRTAGQQLPVVTLASQLAQQSRLLAANTAPLLMADSQVGRRTIVFRLKQQAAELNSLIDTLVGRGVAPVPLGRLIQLSHALVDNIEFLDGRMTERILAAEAVDAHARQLDRLNAALLGLSAGSGGKRPENPALTAWLDLAQRVVLLAATSVRLSDPEAIQAERDRANALGLSLILAGAQLDPAAAESLQPAVRMLERLLSPAGGLWPTLAAQQEAAGAARLALSQNFGLAERFVQEAGQVAAQIQAAALNETRAVRTAAQELIGMLLGIAGGCLILGVVVLGFVGFGISRPLGRMTAVMARLAAGDLAPTVPGHRRNDELGDIARAVETFKANMSERLRRAEDNERALRELRERQDHLVQAAKIASLGQLVGGMSHELNTPVSVMVTGASKMVEELAGLREQFGRGRLRKKGFREFLDHGQDLASLMLANSQRAGELISLFKQVAGEPSAADIRTFRLRAYLEDAAASLIPESGPPRYRLSVRCPDELTVTTCPDALLQVLTNLTLHAQDHAFEGGQTGEITISVRPANETQLEMVFADNGQALAAEDLPRLFDPFFLPRRRSGASGLGLYIVYNTVSRMLQGRITVRSSEGQGTAFTILFPRLIRSDPAT
jgi:signal transduction histidine kinase